MKKSKLLLLTTPLILLPYSMSSQALSLEYRHTYTDDGTNEDRVKINHRFANHIGVTLQNDFQAKHVDDKPANESKNKRFSTKNTKLALNYQYKPVHDFSLQPGFNFVTSSSKLSYQPEIQFQYNLTKQLYVKFRYRYEYESSTVNKAPDNINREDVWVGYNFGNVGLVYSYMYRSGQHHRSNGTNSDYWNNVRLEYKITKHWKPYIEVGNVADTYNKNDRNSGRQTRYRVGVNYTF